VWSGGTLINEYNPGDSQKAPFMGWSHSSQRGLWWNGPTQQGPNVIQDDMETIARPYNGFGYAPDLPGGTTILNAIPLISSPSVAFNGCIEKRYDSEFFSYDAPATGSYTFSVQGARHNGARIGMLDADLVVFNSAGAVISSASAGLDESITLNLKPGRYFVQVRGHQDYGDVGRYTLNVSSDPALFFALAQPLPTTGGTQTGMFSEDKITPASGPDELAMLLD
jgi:hypothetical protein